MAIIGRILRMVTNIIRISIFLTALSTLVSFVLAGYALPIAKKQKQTNRVKVQRATSDGAWCWFADPRAVYHKGKHKKTYMGWVDRSGNIRVASFDHRKRFFRTVQIRSRFQYNDHANPALIMRPDGRLVVFWSGHNGKHMYYRVSARSEDISTWHPIQKVFVNTAGSNGYTYPNPVLLRNEKNTYYLFWRGGDRNPTFSTTRDLINWSPAKILIMAPGQRPYVKVASNDKDTIHFAFTDGHPNENISSINYFYYRGGAFYKADGTRIKGISDLPIWPAQADHVYDAYASGINAWVHDIAIDGNGYPVIVYATFPTLTDHRYYYARWTGSGWFRKELISAGGSFNPPPKEPQYSGGITLDHEDPSVVYLSRQFGKYFHIEKWRTLDGGQTWSNIRITRGKSKNVRPVSPRGLRGNDLGVIWMRGDYPSFKRYRTELATIKRVRKKRNKAPQASFTVSKSKGKAPLAIVFDGKKSRDLDGKLRKRVWHFRDRTKSVSGPIKVKHTFKKRGHYFVVLKVIDNKGAQSQFVREIIVR